MVTINKSKLYLKFLTIHSGCLDTIEAFDFSKQAWEIVGKMTEGVRALNAVALPDGIYVLGGYNGQEYLNTV